MTNPRFIPRSYAVSPRAFGRARNLEWNPASPDQAVHLATAQFQHRVACLIYDTLKAHRQTLRAYCETTGQSYERTGSMLNGRTLMRIEDLIVAQKHLGIRVGVAEPVSEGR